MTVEEHLDDARKAVIRARARLNSGDEEHCIEHCREALLHALNALHLSRRDAAPETDTLTALAEPFAISEGFLELFAGLDAVAAGEQGIGALDEPELVLIRTKRVVDAVRDRVG